MARNIQQPTEAQVLAEWYRIQGGLRLRLDEVVVPVHIVADTSAREDSESFKTNQQRAVGWRTTYRLLAPAGGAGTVAFTYISNIWRDAPLGNIIERPDRVIRIEGFEIADSGGTAAFMHAGIGNNTGADFINNVRTAMTQVAPPVQRFLTGGYQGDGTSLEIAASDVVTGLYPGLELARWNKAAGNRIYDDFIELGWELGQVRRGAAGSELGNDTFWLLNGTSNQNFVANYVVTVFPSLSELRV